MTKIQQYEIDVLGSNEEVDEFCETIRDKYSLIVEVITYDGPAGGSAVVRLSHPENDEKVIYECLSNEYSSEEDLSTYEVNT